MVGGVQWVFTVVLLLLLVTGCTCSASETFDPLRINCGGQGFVDDEGAEWVQDVYFLGGSSYTLPPAAGLSPAPVDRSIRVFDTKNLSCYGVPAPSGTYLHRVGFLYGNYDGRNSPPTFDMYVEGVLMHVVRVADKGRVESSALGEANPSGAQFVEFYARVLDGMANICLLPSLGYPLVHSLQIFPVSDDSYSVGRKYYVSPHVRMNTGSRLPVQEDKGFRTWGGDEAKRVGESELVTTSRSVSGTGVAPNFLPEPMFQMVRESGATNHTGYGWLLHGLSELNRWELRLYFVEIEEHVQEGQRVFDVIVNGIVRAEVDILARTRGQHLTAHTMVLPFNFTLPTYTTPSNIVVGLHRSERSLYNPVLAGLEIHELVPAGAARENVEADLSSMFGRSISGYLVSKNRGQARGLREGVLAAIIIAGVGLAAIGTLVSIFGVMWRRQLQQATGGVGGRDVEAPAGRGGEVELGAASLRMLPGVVVRSDDDSHTEEALWQDGRLEGL